MGLSGPQITLLRAMETLIDLQAEHRRLKAEGAGEAERGRAEAQLRHAAQGYAAALDAYVEGRIQERLVRYDAELKRGISRGR